MTDEVKGIAVEAIESYGVDLQLDVAIEEMSELTKEICKSKRGKSNTKEIAEEIADVGIMLYQLMYMFKISENHIDEIMTQKMVRLRDRMTEEGYIDF